MRAAMVIASVCAVVGGGYFLFDQYEKSQQRARVAAAEASYKAWKDERETALQRRVAAVKDTAATMLKNPDSAKFRNVKINPKTQAVCGYINGTNAYGGYAGESKFVGAEGMIYLIKQPYDGKNEAGVAAYYAHCDD
jgi:hypothetical protein